MNTVLSKRWGRRLVGSQGLRQNKAQGAKRPNNKSRCKGSVRVGPAVQSGRGRNGGSVGLVGMF